MFIVAVVTDKRFQQIKRKTAHSNCCKGLPWWQCLYISVLDWRITIYQLLQWGLLRRPATGGKAADAPLGTERPSSGTAQGVVNGACLHPQFVSAVCNCSWLDACLLNGRLVIELLV